MRGAGPEDAGRRHPGHGQRGQLGGGARPPVRLAAVLNSYSISAILLLFTLAAPEHFAPEEEIKISVLDVLITFLLETLH